MKIKIMSNYDKFANFMKIVKEYSVMNGKASKQMMSAGTSGIHSGNVNSNKLDTFVKSSKKAEK